MTDPADLAVAGERFDKGRRRVAVAAALLHTIDLELLELYYQRAGSPQSIIAGDVGPGLLPAIESWAATIAAAKALRDSIQFDPDVLATLNQMFGTMKPEI
jgi:hypothetical protein